MNGRPHGGYARRFLALAALTALMGATVSCSGTGGSKPVSSATKTLRWGGRDRSYAIGLEHTVNRQTPIVLVLHLPQSAAGTTPGFSGFAEQAARRGAIVVLPEGYQFSWNAGVCCGAAVTKQIDDLGFLQRLLSIIQHQFGDQTRPVYVVGFSNGGFMALRLACAGTRLAGIAIVEASLGVSHCQPRSMDLLQIHQLGDQAITQIRIG